MTEIFLVRLLMKVTVPVVGETKLSHVDGAAKAVDLELAEDEIACLAFLMLWLEPWLRVAGRKPEM